METIGFEIQQMEYVYKKRRENILETLESWNCSDTCRAFSKNCTCEECALKIHEDKCVLEKIISDIRETI